MQLRETFINADIRQIASLKDKKRHFLCHKTIKNMRKDLNNWEWQLNNSTTIVVWMCLLWSNEDVISIIVADNQQKKGHRL